MRRLRKSVKKKIAGCVGGILVLVVVVSLTGVCAGKYYEKKYRPMLMEKQEQIDQAQRFVYVATKDIAPGELFTEQNSMFCCAMSEEEREVLAADVFGKTANTALKAGAFIHWDQCTEMINDDTERECIFTDIACADGFPALAVVDVRLRYPNGENYCVLKKKRLYKSETSTEESRLFLNESEQVLISAARYDAAIFSGAELYYVAFLEERLQEDTESRYIPSEQSIRQLMELGDPMATMSWINLRKALEQRQNEERERRLMGY